MKRSLAPSRSIFTLGLLGVASLSATALASDHATSRQPNYFAGPVDTSRSIVLRNVQLDISRAESSIPLRELRDVREEVEQEKGDHPPLTRPRSGARVRKFDPVAQTDAPIVEMPTAVVSFAGQGTSTTTNGGIMPPDTNGAVGPNHYVQTVNSGIAIYTRNGTMVGSAKGLDSLWAGYTGTHAGNHCSDQGYGDPVVIYDQLADRWFITQFSLPNQNTNGGPSFQCVAVSKTSDPTGAYWLYDFQYPYSINDYGKFGMWPDAYYANFNGFNGNNATDDMCAYNRAAMLQGQPTEQQCFEATNTNGYAALPANLDGFVPPPRGTPGYFVLLGADAQGNFNNTLELFSFHVDWTTPSNSKLTGPVVIPVATISDVCAGGNTDTCVPQGGTTVKIPALSDRLMFRFNYRNFGTHESLLVNHSAGTGNSTSGVRWYEIRSPRSSPTIYQQGTYGPNDGKWRWGGSIAQDMAQGMGLGFSISSSSQKPSIAWTGRLASDALGQMAQGESQVIAGTGVESTSGGRWGDYSSMVLDPTDDCTFWYTTELYKTSGGVSWDTQVATFKFPNCGANDFTIALSSGVKNVKPGGTTNVTVTTTASKGTAEPITLNVQDLPTGVTATFNPAKVTAGATSTMTLTAAASAAITPATSFIVIGTADSAVHKADGQVAIVNCTPKTCTAGQCNSIDDGCGGMTDCGTCGAGQSCVANVCQANAPDGGPGPNPGTDGGNGNGGVDSGSSSNGNGDNSSGSSDTSANTGGCGCRAAGANGGEPIAWLGALGAGLIAAMRLRRRRAR